MKIKICFSTTQQFGPARAGELSVEADRILCAEGELTALNEGEVTLSIPWEAVSEIDLGQAQRDLVAARQSGYHERMARIRARHPQHGKPWSDEDDERLTELWRGGATISELSAQFGRGQGAIRSRLGRLGLVDVVPRQGVGSGGWAAGPG